MTGVIGIFIKSCFCASENDGVLWLVRKWPHSYCVAIVEGDVLIEPQTVVSWTTGLIKTGMEMYLSRAPLAACPSLHCTNVNGGLGDIGSDPPHLLSGHFPLLFFSIKTAGIFQRVLALWLMCNSSKRHLPPHSVIHWPGCQRCFLLNTLFPESWVESHLPLPSLPFSLSPLHSDSFLFTFIQLQIALLSASHYTHMLNMTIIGTSTNSRFLSKSQAPYRF